MEVSKLKALIIDDEPLAHKIILNFAEDISSLEIIGQSYLALDALNFIKNHEVDLIFLDIQMPKLNGLDFLRILDHKPLVIITSAYQEYAIEGYELNVCDYLLKPFRFERFLKAIHKALELKQLTSNPEIEKETSISKGQLFIKSEKRHIQLNYEDIYYLESYGNYVKVWLEKEFHLTARTLISFEKTLPAQQFIRIHKSYIINKQHIHFLEGNQVMMKNEKALLLGRNHRLAIKSLIDSLK